MPPVPKAQIFYNNPFWVGTTVDEAVPWRWYFDHPRRGVVTPALHTFNLTDQDLLFTYSRDLDPWYRLPLGVINHGAVALGFIGLILLGRRIHAAREREERDAYLMLLALIGANWAAYAWTTVEMRYGSVLLLVLFPLAGYTAMRVAAERKVRITAVAALGVSGYIVFALLLSGWVRGQSAPIREAVALDPPAMVPFPGQRHHNLSERAVPRLHVPGTRGGSVASFTRPSSHRDFMDRMSARAHPRSTQRR